MKAKILLSLFIILFISCKTTDDIVIDPIVIETPIITEVIPEPTADELMDIQIDAIIAGMTLEEKIGQLFIFHIRGHKYFDSELSDLITTYKPGGIILFANNITDNNQVEDLIIGLQSVTTIPMFIGVDEEGGIVSRLGKNKNVDVTHLPPALTIGNKNNTELAYNSGRILGRELTALGFNMDMAPVADVNTNPKNPVIGNRTYSADPIIAGEMVSSIIKGFHEENMISIMKHFPGHGDTSTDSHLGTVVSPHGRERLDQIEFVPFIKGIEAGVDGIMTAHMVMPGISSSPLPATLNSEIITGILREDLRFDGMIMTDALDMGAISQNYSSGEAAVLAIKAGVDILLIPANQPNAFKALIKSVLNNDITEERINLSVYRILKVKLSRKLLETDIIKESIVDVSNDSVHKQLIQSIFE